jgi:integrase
MNVKYKVIKGKKKYSSLLVRFWDSKRIDQTASTGFHVKYSDWSNKKQRLKITITDANYDEINHKLEKLERYIVNQYNSDFNSNTPILKSWLKETISSFFNRVKSDETYKAYFVDWFKMYTDEVHKKLHRGKPISNETVKKYKATLTKLQLFEEYKGIRYKHEDIDLNFHRDFINYCREKLELMPNSIGVFIGKIKAVCKEIELQGLPINPIYKHKNFVVPENPTYDIYLNEEEIEKIMNHDFSHSERLDNARDLFIINLRTGFRISDLMKLKKENFLGDKINLTPGKTGFNRSIPIHPNISTTLEKRNGELPRIISQQKFNKYIKEIAQEVEINEKTFGSKVVKGGKKKEGYYEKWELVTSHTGRRSAATNLFLEFEGDERMGMRVTGHKKVENFEKYIKASEDEYFKAVEKKWQEKYKR